MDWDVELLLVARLLLASFFGALVGWEREIHGREAGIRTYATIALGACVFGLISCHLDAGSQPQVVSAGVVTGVGFLGAGVILRKNERITGLTTAATIWSTASLGLSFAYGMYLVGVTTALLILAFLSIHHLPGWAKIKSKKHSEKTEGYD